MVACKWACLALVFLCVPYAAPHSGPWHRSEPTPADIIVDVINNLGLNILKIHNSNNENNIALSPYGVASILTALLEGVRGRAAFEIQQCGGFPADKDTLRVGLRDIHRLLRSYFIPHEGFLSGLSLSSEKVILKPEYQSVLRFYGFDMTSFNTPIYPDITTTVVNNITASTELPTTSDISTLPVDTTTQTSNSNTDTTTQLTSTEKTTILIEETSTIQNETSTVSQSEITTIKTSDFTTLPPVETTVSSIPTATETTTLTTTEVLTTESSTVLTTQPDTEIPDTTTSLPMDTEILVTENAKLTLTTTDISYDVTTNTNMESTIETSTETVTNENLEISTDMNTESSTNLNVETSTFNAVATTFDIDTTTSLTSETTEMPQTTTDARLKRSIVDYIIARYYDERNPTSFTPDLPKNKYSFLVSGKYQEPHVNFMTYETVLSFFYIHNLNALALKFPLDSPKYYLLLILPVDEQGIDRLICDIGKYAGLKDIISHLRPTYIRAIIPSFMLRGFVILTSTLQKIGIRQIFEPRHSDFSPMTEDKEIYVTNIEQAITVTIKNYMDPGVLNKNSNFYEYGPVEFKATHPFLYFVMDSEIDVTLVAGKIVNPINSRIQ